jgi:hypothetical protein
MKKPLFILTFIFAGATLYVTTLFVHITTAEALTAVVGYAILWAMFFKIVSFVAQEYKPERNERTFPRPGVWNKELE